MSLNNYSGKVYADFGKIISQDDILAHGDLVSEKNSYISANTASATVYKAHILNNTSGTLRFFGTGSATEQQKVTHMDPTGSASSWGQSIADIINALGAYGLIGTK